MAADLQTEIKMQRPFQRLEEEAILNLARTYSVTMGEHEHLIEPFGISSAQYNILRILRGAGAEGLGRNEIRDRLLTRLPDVTRLLDRMERSGLVRRQRGGKDRRCVPTFLTEEGRALVAKLDKPIAELQRRQVRALSPEQLRTLIQLLTLLRSSTG
jgi:DNA-binding MarR family transcriptional regulator